MDQKLYEASQVGNYVMLSRQKINNRDRINVIKVRKPSYVETRNDYGFTPMHIAASNGYVDIVREQLRLGGARVCHLRGGRTDWTPLHCAAFRGRLEILGEIVAASPESLEDMTVHEETALYIAAKNCQEEAVQALVELVVKSRTIAMEKKKMILNMKDKNGNSVLHIAIRKRLHQAAEFLVGTRLMEINHVNEAGHTALDVLLRLPKISKSAYAAEKKTKEILHAAGALTAEGVAAALIVSSNCMPSHEAEDHRRRSDHQLRKRVLQRPQASTAFS